MNISGHLDLEPLMSRLRRKAYVDLDPGFTQFWHADGTGGARLEGHDVYFTVGENIGRPDCADPDLRARTGSRCARRSCSRSGRSPTAATRIGSRRSAHGAGAFGPVEFDGHTYSLKVHEFRKVIELPRRSPQRFEIALDIHPGDERDREALEANGWTPGRPARDRPRPARVPRLRAGIGRGVLGRAGHLRGDEQRLVQRPHRALPGVRPPRRWSRTPASARNLPGRRRAAGLRATSTGPWQGAQRIAADYEHHRRAARAVAEAHFDSDTVLSRFLEEAGIELLTRAEPAAACGTGGLHAEGDRC